MHLSQLLTERDIQISDLKKERELLSDDHPRKRRYTSDDEYGNNQVPYSFHEFGPDHFFGQSITHWTPILPIN